MKKFKMNKYLAFGLAILVTAILFVVGKDHSLHAGETLATVGAAISLTEQEKAGFTESEQKMILAVKKLTAQMQDQVKAGLISKEELNAAISGIKTELSGGEIKNLQDELKRLDDAAKAQGTSLTQLHAKLQDGNALTKTIAAQLEEDRDALKTIYQNGTGSKTYMVTTNSKGEFVMKPYDLVDGAKAAGPHAASAAVGGGGNVASIAQSIDAATLLRLGGQSPIMAQFRNSPWVFGLCNLINAGFEQPFAMWYDEIAKDGASANVAEGGTKPTVQYKYQLKTDTYKKEAMLVSFTDEFSLDFRRLQDEILGKARVDLINRINSAILPRIISSATAFNTAVQFKDGVVIDNVNDFDVIAAMAAQVENATFATTANTAVMSTFKKHRLGIQKNTQGSYLNPPASLSNIAFVGNPDMSTGNILVGDFLNYNIILRGGMIVKVGYNGNDFANNMFSTVLEQYFFDYISSARTSSIVKGPDFATVKTAISS